jgi:hypothetical protein
MKLSEISWSCVFLFLMAVSPAAFAAGDDPSALATRPWCTVFASSITKFDDACQLVFQSVDRPDLAASLSDRRKSYRDFAGIDRTKPAGVMSVWAEDKSSDIVFLPVDDVEELLKTATFEVVDFHSVGPGQYEIERPGSPYHVLVRNGYAFFADSIAQIQALTVTPEQLTRNLRDRYDVVAQFDFKQIPRITKDGFVDDIRAQTEPWLQPQDDELPESAAVRRTLGKLALELLQRAVLDTTELTLGGRLDPKTRHLIFEAIIEVQPKSGSANTLTRLTTRQRKFAPLIASDAPASLAINMPLDGFIEQILGNSAENSSQGRQLEMGLQVIGGDEGQLSFLLAVRGSEASELNKAIPGLIMKLQESGRFAEVNPNFELYQAVTLHSLIPRELPSLWASLVGLNAEIIVGQGEKIVWLAVGAPAKLFDQLKAAIEAAGSTETETSTPLVRGRFQAKLLPELVATDLLSPTLDAQAARDELAKGGDGFSVVIQPIANGLKLKIEAEEGFVRLIGRDWAKKVDDAN